MKYSELTRNVLFLFTTLFALNASGFCQETTIASDTLSVMRNPIGKTWVVFVENSNYISFPFLEGPKKDFSHLQTALLNYHIDNIIHLKDMKRREMEKFFITDLGDSLIQNKVNSLLIWYAGHGKLKNNVGYWIPVDAKSDDELSFFSIDLLKTCLKDYQKSVTHLLIVSDASEAGPYFYKPSRFDMDDNPDCKNAIYIKAISAQVFSSAGYEQASDNSKFANEFANSLENNKNDCLSIETIVKSVTKTFVSEDGQRPQYGRIAELKDSNGTFFFLKK
jgi:hypothetical protein